MRRVELYLAGLLLLLASFAAWVGARTSRDQDLVDPRLSTTLRGPQGALALAEALETLGLTVARRERGYFTVSTTSGTMYAFLDLSVLPTDRERLRIWQLARDGGHLLLAGRTGVETCFGISLQRDDPAEPMSTTSGAPRWVLPEVEYSYRPGEAERPDADEPDCRPSSVIATDTALVRPDGEPVALRLRLDGGGSVSAIADPDLLTNEALRDTDAGIVLIPWLLQTGVDRMLVDEYHHGFRTGGSLWGAAAEWLRTSPAGWSILQLVAAALVALFALGVRFGPPRPYRRVNRRSELEHVDALGAGLHHAGGHQTAVDLLLGGLGRRLGRSGTAPRDPQAWLASFDHLDAPAARRARDTLANITNVPAASRVRTTADAVEDLWIAMTTRQ